MFKIKERGREICKEVKQVLKDERGAIGAFEILIGVAITIIAAIAVIAVIRARFPELAETLFDKIINF